MTTFSAADWPTLVQASSAAVSACGTVALLWITYRYALSAEKTLATLQQERTDRLVAKQAPGHNAIARVDEMMLAVQAALRSDESIGQAVMVREFIGATVGMVNQAAQTMPFAPLSQAIAKLSLVISDLRNAWPSSPNQQPLPSKSDLYAHVGTIENEVKQLRMLLDAYTG
jgi:hypothetical protein